GDPTAIAAYALVEHDFSHDLRAIRAPTLVIWGSEDKVAPLRTGQLTAALIPGARLALLDGVAHTPMLEQPERFNALVADELERRCRRHPFRDLRSHRPQPRPRLCDAIPVGVRRRTRGRRHAQPTSHRAAVSRPALVDQGTSARSPRAAHERR